MPSTHTVVQLSLPRNHVGQILDVIEVLIERWEATAAYLLIRECSDAEEAEWIAGFYEEMATDIRRQLAAHDSTGSQPMTRITLAALAAVTLLAQDLSGPVVQVIDGDTIEVELAGEVERVRYIGIDTPEMNDPRPEVRELAAEAKEACGSLRADGGET